LDDCDILFIHPPHLLKRDYIKMGEFARNSYIFFPMGVLAIADLCEREGFSAKILNYPLEQYLNKNWQLSKFLKNQDFKVCGIDLHFFHNIYGATEVAKIVKKINPNAKVIVGGFTASYFHDEILKHHNSVDGVIKGEGEIPFLNYVKNISKNQPVDTVPNLSYRNSSNHIKINPITYIAENLDDLNFTNISLVHNGRKYVEYSYKIMGNPFNLPIGRGCPFNCPFCGGGKDSQLLLTGRKKVVLRSPEKVIEDLHNIFDNYKVHGVYFGHGAYPATLKYWMKLFKLIRREKLELGAEFEIWRLPFSKEMWLNFYKTFTRRYSAIDISPQTMSVRVQKKYARVCDSSFRYSKKEIEDLIKQANLFRITLRIWLTIGFPFQKLSDLIKDFLFNLKITLKYGKSLTKPISIMNLPVTVPPASPAYENSEKLGIEMTHSLYSDLVVIFKRTKFKFWNFNDIVNYRTKHFSNISIRAWNMIFNLTNFLAFATSFPRDSK